MGEREKTDMLFFGGAHYFVPQRFFECKSDVHADHGQP